MTEPVPEPSPELALRVRLDILEMICSAGSGHPGGSLSIVEILVLLFFEQLELRPAEPHWEQRDRFILSKGHGCPALYSVMARRGFFDPQELETLRRMGSRLQGHPDMSKLPGLDASTGSLGQGLPIAVGMALGTAMQGLECTVYCLMGDGELQEGSVWEAAMSASYRSLANLVAIVDRNRIQLDGHLSDIKEIEPLADKWRSFGWAVAEADGHDFDSLRSGLDRCREAGGPAVLIARTLKGKGVSWMEDTCLWHGACPDEDEYRKAVAELDGTAT